MFFHIYFIVIKQKYRRLKRSISDKNTGAGSHQKANKNKFNYFFHKKKIVNQCPINSTYPNQNLEIKYCLDDFFSCKCWLRSQLTGHCIDRKIFLPTTIKSHVVKIVITWSISPPKTITLDWSIDIYVSITQSKSYD